MNDQAYWRTKGFYTLIAASFFWTVFLIVVFGFMRPVMAGSPVDGEVYFYDVEQQRFKVVWQVDTALSTPPGVCTVNVYDQGGNQLSPPPNITSITDDSTVLRERGIMVVEVSDLDENTTYLVQTVSKDSQGDEHFYPQPAVPGTLLPVTTEKTVMGTGKDNGELALVVYGPSGITGDPTQNIIPDYDKVIVLVETEGANYPMRTTFDDITGTGIFGYFVDFGLFMDRDSQNASQWLDWTTDENDHPFMIRILGGLNPSAGLGQKTIYKTYLNSDEGPIFPCLADGGNDIASCYSFEGLFLNQIILTYTQPPENQSPVITGLETQYTAEVGVLFTTKICATDPDGDTIGTFILGGNKPVDMSIEADPTDANCAIIEWTPPECVNYNDVTVNVQDDKGATAQGSFDIDVTNCPPNKPSASIGPVPPSSADTLTCTVDPASISDPDEDPVKLNYKWYEVGNPNPIQEILNSDQNQNTLDFSKTVKDKQYYCVVTATDDTNKTSAAETTITLSVLNSAPSAPAAGDVTVSSESSPPTVDQNLTCTIGTPSTDPDTGDSVDYIYQWKCTGCGDKTIDARTLEGLSDTLLSANTAKGENWFCEVSATDGDLVSSSTPSNTVNIENRSPSDPGNVQITNTLPVYTEDSLTCTIGTESTDPDTGDEVTYEFSWTCDNCGGKTIDTQTITGLSDTLLDTNTAKNETWSCTVQAKDDFGGASSPITATPDPVTIQNSPPEGLSVEITPDPAYDEDNLICTASNATDADEDTISYKYEWKKDGVIVPALTKDFAEGVTEDSIQASNTSQGETWACVVTAKDTDNAQDVESDEVIIGNRPPIITTDPAGETQMLDEGVESTIQIIVNDPDGNTYTLEIDTNYVDPGDPNVSEWVDYTNDILTITPPLGSSSRDEGYGLGTLIFNFIAEEIDGVPENLSVAQSLTVKIRFPAEVVDNFEYPANKTSLAANNWFWVLGSGRMELIQEDTSDPNTNHYLKTRVTVTPTNNSQLQYNIMKHVPDNLFNNDYPVIQVSIRDKNFFYIDAYVRGRNDAGSESNFFLRYIPQNPIGTQVVSGRHVKTNVGSDLIDPNGTITAVLERNMDEDLKNTTGFNYLYLKGILIRGDIDFMDDIKVLSAGPPEKLLDVENLTAEADENQVTLGWVLPEGQSKNIARYNIYMQEGNDPPPVDEAFKIDYVASDANSYTKTGLNNETTYCFRVTAMDNRLEPNETEGKTVCAMPNVTVPFAPIEPNAEAEDGMIKLSWRNPSNQHLDVTGYMIYYCDCVPVSVDCNDCYYDFVAASKADSSGLFVHYVMKDASQEPLQYGNTYHFTIMARDAAQPVNFSDGEHVSILLIAPAKKVIDNFEYETLQGWNRLQGKGTSSRKEGDGGNHYLELKSGYTGSSILDYIMVKWLRNPTDHTNPNLSMTVRSQGDFRIDVYLKGTDDKNYFLSYKADKNAEEDSNSAVVEDKRWFVYTIGWKNKASATEWYSIERNLDDDIQSAKGVGFKMVLGILLRGTLDIDNTELGEGVLDVKNLTARPGNATVLLSWTVVDPNKIDDTLIYVDNILDANSNDIVKIPGENNDYQYEKTGLDNDTTYEFKVAHVAGDDEGKSASVSATPMEYITRFTFDVPSDKDEWSLPYTDGVVFDVRYDSGVQSNVMYLNPNSAYPDRYYISKEGINESGVTEMSLRIKTGTNFVIWLFLNDTSGLPVMLGFVPGGTLGDYSRFGNFAYYFLGPGLTDDNWHLLDLKLDDIMNGIFTGTDIEADKINSIYIGGRIFVDDITIY